MVQPQNPAVALRSPDGASRLSAAPFGLDVESGLEGNVARALLALPNIIGLFSQPFTIFFDTEVARSRYTPDFLLVLGCVNPRLARRGFERWTVIEVKTATRYQELRDPIETKLSLVRRMLGFATVCITEANLEEILS